MLNIIQNTIGAIRRVGESVVRAGLKMWLPFTTAEVGASNQTTPDISGNDNNAILKTGKALQFTGNDSVDTDFSSSITIKTIAFWIKPTHSSTNEVVFYGGGGQGGTRQLYLDHLQLEAINSNISMSTYVNGTLEGVTYNGTPATLTQDEWQRVVLTSSTGFTVVSDTFDIGSGLYGSDGRFIMSDLQIYDEAWTTDDIAYDYANPQKLVTDNTSSTISLSNLKGYWAFTEGDGGIAYDSSGGAAYEGTITGASYVDAQDRIPQLGMMNWSKGSNLLLHSEDFTNSYWTKDNVTVENSYLAPDGTLSAYKISADSSGQGFGYKAGVNANGKTKTIWAKTVSGSGQTCINIKNDYTGALVTITNEWQRFEQPSSVVSNDNFYLVDFRHASNTLDEVIVWGAQLEEGSSASAYRRTNGTAVTDATLISSANDSQKDILGNAVRVKGSGFNLDGTGYGEVPHTTDFNFGTGDFSVSAWVKFSFILQGTSSFNAIYTNGGQVDANNTFSIISVNPNKIAVLVNGTSAVSTSTFSEGEWVHIVATRNSGTISLYINGNKTPEDTDTDSNTVTSSQNPRIGFDGNNQRFYNGIVDDVQVYDDYLTSDQVEQNYNATKSGHNN